MDYNLCRIHEEENDEELLTQEELEVISDGFIPMKGGALGYSGYDPFLDEDGNFDPTIENVLAFEDR